MLKKGHLLKSVVMLLMIAVLVLFPFGQKKVEFEATTSDNYATLSNEINQILTDQRLLGATSGVSIRKASNGEIIYSNLGDTRVHPASVMKLLTGGTALETLGESYTFKTEVYTDGEIKNGMLHGNLYLRGQGDPTLMVKDLNVFATHLKGKGIHSIKGNIYGDDTWYDDERLSQDLNWSDEPFYTGAQVSALTISPNDDYDTGTVIVEVNPANKVDEKGIVSMDPANEYMKIVNNTTTVAKDGKKSVQVEREHGTNTLIVTGTIPLGTTKTRSWAAVWEPTNYTIHLLKKEIDAHGIKFSGTPKIERKIVPKGATLLTMKQSIPLKELFIPFMKLSNNGHAEMLVKEMGKVVGGEGSWDKGLEVVESTLVTMGIDTETLLLRDGSGMSHKNLLTANEVSKLLYSVQSKPWYPTLMKALPVAGNEDRFVGGTLRTRMKETVAVNNVKAKTGSLTGVTALSGYATTKDGETLIFSIMINNYLDSTTYLVPDFIAIAIANYQTN